MANIFGSLESEGSVFRDERALMPEYLPEELPHRESEIKEMALALKAVSKGGTPENMVLIGPPGTGKTSCAKSILQQLSEYSKKALPIYINCWELSTRHAILGRLATSLGQFVPRRGVATDEVSDRIAEFLGKEKKIPIIVLDEVDRLVTNQYREESILYDLARGSEVFGAPIGVVGITNHEWFLTKLDSRIISSLSQHRIYFKPYSPQQLKDILNERAKLAFVRDALEEEVIPLCAGIGAKRGGDARVAIATLWKAGKLADRKGAKKVSVEHVKEASQEKVEHEKMENLEPLEKRMLAIIEAGSIASGELYEKLKREGVTNRTVRNHLEKFEKLGLIETEVKADKGRTRVIRRTV
ncbi:MAG: AAA family ATPase [Candidatus Micrarchaeota archaeon]